MNGLDLATSAPSPSDAETLADLLGPPQGLLVAVDFDGTLSAIVDRPDAAVPAPGALDALRRLATTTTVAVVSGRRIDDLDAQLDGLPVALAGGHGAQVRHTDGTRDDLVDPARLTPVLERVHGDVTTVLGDTPGWLVERKPTSVAVHHRLAAQEDVDALLPRVEALLRHHADGPPAFVLLHGKAVVELRPDGVDKGAALRRLAARSPGLVPVAIGDDATDEDTFRVARELGGHAVLVADQPRPSLATHRLDDPTAVVALLDTLHARAVRAGATRR